MRPCISEAILRQLANNVRMIPGIGAEAADPLDAVWQKGLPTYFQQFPATLPNHSLAGQSFGAGVCFVWSSGNIRRCKFVENHVTGRGGGIGVVGYGWPTIDSCLFQRNRARAQTRRDGGGIGIEVGIPERLGRNLKVEHLIADMELWLRHLGAGEVSRLAYSFVGAAISYVRSVVSGQQSVAISGREFLTLLIHLLVKAYLSHRRYSIWDQSHLQAARTARVLVRNCRFVRNVAFDDGGGIYASVLSRLHVKDSQFLENQATNGGGGAIRCSLGSDIIISDCQFLGNCAGGDRGRVGGGAIAVRNGDVQIVGSTEQRANRCDSWAGGAMQLSAESEGGATFMGGLLPSYYTAILLAVFEFDQMSVHIARPVVITENHAYDTSSGKGGGLYVLRGSELDVPPLSMRINEYRRVVSGNLAHVRPAADVNDLHLVDLTTGARINDGNVVSILQSGNLVYESGI